MVQIDAVYGETTHLTKPVRCCFEECEVETLAWGKDDNALGTSVVGYVIVNGVRRLDTTWNEDTRGFSTIELALGSCSTTNLRRFDTYGSKGDSDALGSYVKSLPSRTILIGVTADSSEGALTSAAKDALNGIGVNVYSLSYRGKVAFVAQVGRPSAAVMHIAPLGGNSVKMNVLIISRLYVYYMNCNCVVLNLYFYCIVVLMINVTAVY